MIFDFDGVIADSKVLANTVLAEMVSELGVPTTLEDSYARYMGKRFDEVMAAVAETIGAPCRKISPNVFRGAAWKGFAAIWSRCPVRWNSSTTSPPHRNVLRRHLHRPAFRSALRSWILRRASAPTSTAPPRWRAANRIRISSCMRRRK
ncbi:MAG: HAD hydrolase-like protein [Rhodospirillaceae bacterium]|nr:HAD hydrolase-like protein [Rhodospirillaceae bacterium]MBT5298585.1 HAD hydrolase-like protein [Rhodospirillaceae bacterium]